VTQKFELAYFAMPLLNKSNLDVEALQSIVHARDNYSFVDALEGDRL